GVGQALEWRLEPLRVGQKVFAGDPRVLEDKLGCDGGAHGELGLDVLSREPWGSLFDQEAPNDTVQLRPHEGDVGDRTVGDPHLRTVEEIVVAVAPGLRRSEEHTSELQSRGHLVCRLLLEKKKMTTTHAPIPTRLKRTSTS